MLNEQRHPIGCVTVSLMASTPHPLAIAPGMQRARVVPTKALDPGGEAAYLWTGQLHPPPGPGPPLGGVFYRGTSATAQEEGIRGNQCGCCVCAHVTGVPRGRALAFRQLLVGGRGESQQSHVLPPPLLPQVVFGDFLLSATSPASGGGGPMLEGVLKCGGPGEGMVQP